MQSQDRSVYDTLLQLDETAGLIQSKNGIILLIAQHEAQLNLGGCEDGSAFALLSEHAANPGVAEEVDWRERHMSKVTPTQEKRCVTRRKEKVLRGGSNAAS